MFGNHFDRSNLEQSKAEQKNEIGKQKLDQNFASRSSNLQHGKRP